MSGAARILLVGERISLTESQATMPAPSLWIKRALAEGCFHDGAGRVKLESVSCKWTHSMNLLPPGHGWDAEYAASVAAKLTGYDRLLLLGRRVQAAFKIPGQPQWGRLIDDKFVIVPHPSGLNRVWNTLDVGSLGYRVLMSLDVWVTTRCCICDQPARGQCAECARHVCMSCWPLHRPAHMGVIGVA